MSKAQQVDKNQVFEKETQILSHSKSVLNQSVEELSVNTLRKEYEQLSQSYAQLLGEVKLLTSVSDRLQSRLDKATENVNKKDTELNTALTILDKSKTNMTITNIVFMLFIGLFLIIDWTIDANLFMDENIMSKITEEVADLADRQKMEDIPDFVHGKLSAFFQEEQSMEIIIKLVIIALIFPIRFFLAYLLQRTSKTKKQSVAILE
ncbi:MAG: hypothetical protein MUE81_07265 [Thermoflexibacter sp.]|jgi:hypothetical protein|nr:hypothetical protein [Thermoflexibacter sp.]